MSNFSTYFKNKEDKNDFYIAIGVIVLFLGCGIFYGLNLFNTQGFLASTFEGDQKTETYIADEVAGFQFENEEDKTFTLPLLKDKRNIDRIDNSLKNDTATQTEEASGHLSIENMIDSIEANKEETAKANTEITATETTIDTTAITNTSTDTTTQVEDTIESLNNTTITSTTKEKPSDEKLKQPSTQVNQNDKTSSVSSNCIIVVGAFSLGENADKLKKTLIKKGYPAYTFFRKGNKVVGIKQSCDNTKATQKMLKQVQKEYNASAWLLKK